MFSVNYIWFSAVECATIRPAKAPVAQLDRVPVSEAVGQWFESTRARQLSEGLYRTHGLHIIPETWVTILRIIGSSPLGSGAHVNLFLLRIINIA